MMWFLLGVYASVAVVVPGRREDAHSTTGTRCMSAKRLHAAGSERVTRAAGGHESRMRILESFSYDGCRDPPRFDTTSTRSPKFRHRALGRVQSATRETPSHPTVRVRSAEPSSCLYLSGLG